MDHCVGYAVRTVNAEKGTHSVPYEAVDKRLPIPFSIKFAETNFYAKRCALDFLSRTQVMYYFFKRLFTGPVGLESSGRLRRLPCGDWPFSGIAEGLAIT